jgi:uncharacterized protein YqjF (DUF2071 family)
MPLPLFLSARWQHLLMINYEIDPDVLTPFIPRGTEIDLWQGKAYVSVVGFMFLDTYVRGLPIPFHRNFEEVNLRFYIKRSHLPEGERRAVGFIKEIVPRWGIAYLARRLYNENYVALPMRHVIEQKQNQISAAYYWKYKKKWQSIQVSCQNEPQYPSVNSEAEFITEHYWGYSKQRNGDTMEYQVEHPRWRVWQADHHEIDVDVNGLYGPVFAPFLEKSPSSVFLAEGSQVNVYKGQKLLLH